MAGPEWSSIKMADVQRNVLTGGREGVSAADALKARSDAYQAGKSHGAARFFKGLFSLGINELWRFANYRSYESDKAKIVNCVKDTYKALAPKLGPQAVTVYFNDDDGPSFSNVNLRSQNTATPYVQHETANVRLTSDRATITRNANGSGTVRLSSGTELTIDDCERVRRHLEMEFMRHADRFGKDFVMGILNDYKGKALANVREDGGYEAGKLHFGEGDDKQSIGVRRGMKLVTLPIASTEEQFGAIDSGMQDRSVKSAARDHLKAMLSAFYSSQLDLPEEVGRTMELDLGVSLVQKVLDGEIEDGKKLQAFLDKGSKGVHLTTSESQKVMNAFEKAEASHDEDVSKVKVSKDIFAPKDARPTLPQGEVKKLHDFVADLVMNEDQTQYDKSLDAGKLTGLRLRALVGSNKALVASLMQKQGADLDDALKTLEPKMAKALKEDVLAPLEKKYQEFAKGGNGRNAKVSREVWLSNSIRDSQRGAAKLRVALGVHSDDELNDGTIDLLTYDKKVRDALREGGAEIADGDMLSDEAGRRQIALGLDFFGEMEKKVEAAVADALKDVQKTLGDKIDAIFGADEAAEVNKSADELGGMSLEEMKNAYSKDPDLMLVKTTLKSYFKDIGLVQQRAMLAAQTRFCAEVPGTTTEGARFGALLKGAGPVMQKMLQGIDENKINDEDFKLAIADMKDNLAPIPEKAIKAALFDLVKNSGDPKITSIEVKASLGQASVGQALLCTVKRDGLEPQECVVKILRPNAGIAAEREYDIFMAACGNDASMKATFQGRFDSIKEELDLTIEAKNMQIADKTYSYNKEVAEIGTFTNTTSSKLFGGVKPTSTVMIQEKAEGTTVKKFIDSTKRLLADPNSNIPQDELEALKEKLAKTHSALVSTSYMWANEGLFGSGFYHGDLHAGNLMVDDNGKITMIDFGNATQLDKAGRTNVTRVITGAAVGNVDIFLKGYVELLGADGKAKYQANEAAIKAKLGKVFEKQGLADTALRMSIVLNILQLDYKIEVPGAVHNFLESQKRLAATMDDTAELLAAVNSKLGIANEPKPLSMMQCLVQVVKNNISLNLLTTIGLKNAKGVMDAIRQDPLLAPQAANPQPPAGNNGGGDVVIYP